MLVFHPNYPNPSHVFINSLTAPEGVFLPYQDIINDLAFYTLYQTYGVGWFWGSSVSIMVFY